MSEKKAGRPPLRDENDRRTKKVMLAFTKSEYEELKKMQIILNRPTLTSTIQFFIDKGMENVREVFESRGR